MYAQACVWRCGITGLTGGTSKWKWSMRPESHFPRGTRLQWNLITSHTHTHFTGWPPQMRPTAPGISEMSRLHNAHVTNKCWHSLLLCSICYFEVRPQCRSTGELPGFLLDYYYNIYYCYWCCFYLHYCCYVLCSSSSSSNSSRSSIGGNSNHITAIYCPNISVIYTAI